MIFAIITAVLIGFAVFAFIVVKMMLILMLTIVCVVYFVTYLGLDNLLGSDQMAFSIFGTIIIGTAILWVLARITGVAEGKQHAVVQHHIHGSSDVPCPCGSGRIFRNCHGSQDTSQGLKTRPCPCGSGKRFENCHGR